MAVLRSQGTHLYFIDPATGEVMQVGCPTSIDGISAPIEQVETTCLDDQARTYIPGLKAPGPASFTLQFDPQDPSHIRLNELYNTNTTVQWALGLSDGTSAPSADSAGEFLLPPDRSWLLFEGYVSDFPFTIALNTTVQSTLSVQVSGERVVVPRSA